MGFCLTQIKQNQEWNTWTKNYKTFSPSGMIKKKINAPPHPEKKN